MPSVRTERRDSCAWRRCAGGAVVLSALCLLAASLVPSIAAAAGGGIGGYVDLRYDTFETESRDTLGNTTRAENTGIGQRYNLMYSSRLAPYLRLYANGFFDKVDSKSVVNGQRFETTTTTISPVVDLTLRSPIYTAGIKFTRKQDTFTTERSPKETNINEAYQGILGWKPPEPDLPSFQMRIARSHTFDRELVRQNVVSDLASMIMDYAPTYALSMNYRPSYHVTNDRLAGLETQTMTHAGSVQYSDRFLRNRIAIGAGVNAVHSERQVSVDGTGMVDTAVVPFAGLSSIDDTPATDALAPNPALIDGNLTASAGINIGLPPFGGDDRERNIGLDFSFAKEVNLLLLWVDRPLPAAIAGSFSWNIYTSTDNQNWSFLTTVFPAPFGPFDDRFEIAFPPVTTRYIKVVVKPLSPAVSGATGFPDIFVTELQAFSRKPADEARGKTTSSSQVYNVDGRVLLLEAGPTVTYQISYLLQSSKPPEQQQWTLANALMATHRFNKALSGSASVGREDYSYPLENGMAYVASMSLDAVPLRTLRHTLSYSGRFEKHDGSGSKTNNYYLDNVLQVYYGVVLTASGGLTVKDDDTGERFTSTNLKATTSIQPHRTLSFSYYVLAQTSETSGGEGPGSSSRRTDTSASASYYAFQTLYLTAGRTVVSDPQRTLRLRNYGLNWTPFLGSSLQFSFFYSESLSNEDNAKNRSMGPSMQWRITRTTDWLVSYRAMRSTSDTGQADTRTLSTSIRAYF